MPDFFDMVQCLDCGAWYPAGEGLSHRQSHDRSQRKPAKVEYIDLGEGHVAAVVETKRGIVVDIEV